MHAITLRMTACRRRREPIQSSVQAKDLPMPIDIGCFRYVLALTAPEARRA